MRPEFEVKVNGVDVTGSIQSRLVDITLTDQSGNNNDRLEFTLDDGPPHIQVPAKGSKVSLVIGYGFQPGAESRYNGLKQFVGLFEVDETTFSKPPALLKVSCHSNNTGGTFKAQKDREWEDKTIKEIATTIAGEHGLSPVIDGEIGAIKLEHVDQPNQSDMDFLNRLVKQHEGLMKVAEGKLVIAKEGSDTSILTGQSTATQIVLESETSDYTALIQSRSDFDGAVGRWHDWDKAREIVETEGDKAKAVRHPHIRRTKVEAKADAKSRKGKLDKETETLSFTCVGNPKLMAETSIQLVGFRPGIRTSWKIKSATHTLSNSGYTTQCQCELPKAGDKNASTKGRAT